MYRILREIWRLGKPGKKIIPTKGQGPFRRSAAIRHVDAGSCNACELEIQALSGPHYGLEQVGLSLTASPRHADLLMVTGPVTRHMAAALQDTFSAMPNPKKVVAIGDCACTGGIFAGSYAVVGAVEKVLPVAGQCPGCPPTPEAIRQTLVQVARQTRP